VRTRTLVVAGIVVALLIAGVGSYFASRHPDGLMHVAQQAGFADKEKPSATSDSPLSGYQVKGIGNDAVSGGLAGVAGALVVLLLAGGLAYAVRRRGAVDQRPADEHRADADHEGAREPVESPRNHEGD
jgi:cobalt/nickel transport protein